ncbi:hypothetical protein OEA41_007165 [Lepraria neglecta]|uniref:Uncharacterized protein n=1 Tax=Lepraria neglecta TaxID=209136 RepID=A0AAE0DMQ9_9LECA|nr:hypothetical protein OEA41_007165 [Lepraria neglecta]
MSLVNLLWVVLFFVAHGNFAICARAFVRGAPDGGPSGQAKHTSSPTPSAPACHVGIEADGSIRRHVDVKKVCKFTGNLITVTVDQYIKRNNVSSDFPNSDLRIHVRMGSKELVSTHTTLNPNGSKYGSIQWGPLVRGAKLATFNINNGTVSGNVDDRRFNPFRHYDNVAGVTFVDGGPSPTLHAAPNITDALQGLDQLVVRALGSCEVAAPPFDRAATSAHLMPRSNRHQDSGHFSDTYTTSSCSICKIGATATIVTAEIACVLGTCWWSFGAGCVACTAAAVAAETAAIAACEFSNACCPNVCGAGSFPLKPPTCCFGNEICLDGQGHCCTAGQQTCGGRECCNSDQSCISTGPQQGTCCPSTSVCGNQCCPSDTDLCVANSVCCDSADACGSKCCNPTKPPSSGGPDLRLFFCADPVKEVCCMSGQKAIDGVCCDSGSSITCNGECCRGSCGADGRCQSHITDEECFAKG